MYSSSDFEHLFIRYKAESMPQGDSIQEFCLKNKVPYNLFCKWYKDTRHHIVPVQVEIAPERESVNPPPLLPLPAYEGGHCPHTQFLDFPDFGRPSSPGELMEKTVNYLNNFWNQIFAYLKDGRYSIDNSIAERFIRPLAGERKNTLFFDSNRMAHVSVAYHHTLLSTCRTNGIGALAYLKRFFREVVKDRWDYENLLPMTIGISTNKL